MPDDSKVAESDEKKLEDKQLELFEKTEAIAERMEATAQSVAALAQSVADRPVHAPAPAPVQPVPQRLTEEQVMALVEKGDVTQAQGMAYLLKMAREDAKTEARRETVEQLSAVGRHAHQNDVAGKIGEYKKAVPALGQRGSAEWNEVAQRYSELTAEGHPASMITELTALREIYGRDPSKHESVKERTRERARATETPSSAGSRSGGSGRGRAKNEPDTDLPAEVRDYVGKMINIGQYRGWDDPKAQKYVERYKTSPRRRAS